MLYSILTVGRNGSTLLCRLLNATTLFGTAAEWFNPGADNRAVYLKTWDNIDPDPKHALSIIWQKTHSPHTLLAGVKCMPDQWWQYSDAGKNYAFYPSGEPIPFKCIVLERENIRDQAISMLFSVHTNCWSVEKVNEQEVWEEKVEFLAESLSLDEVKGCEAMISKTYVTLNQVLAKKNISPHRLTYESLLKDPLGEVRKIGTFLGVEDINNKIRSITFPDNLFIMRGPWTERVKERMRVAGL